VSRPVTVTTPADPVPESRPGLDRWSVVHWLGEVLVTLGCVLLLFAVYELVWTNVTADHHEATLRHDLEKTFAQPSPSSGASASPSPSGSSSTTVGPPPLTLQVGHAFAVMYIPALGSHWAKAVVEGADLSDLKGTIGHYPNTQAPGEIGNFAVAGHRATNGQPLADIPLITTGSLVYVHTINGWYTYRITSHKIVAPNAVSVLLPVPDRPGVTATLARLTITTCNPRWASFERWIVFGLLQSTRTEAQGPPPGLDVKG
jgi:sortase A